MNVRLLPLAAATYEVHPIHENERVWTETNCYVDVWVELLHSLKLNPLVAAAFSVSTDFEGDQWTFFKYPSEDLWDAYGIDVHEMNPWRSPLVHVVEQLELGRLMTVEADSFFLPDTAGVSYRLTHTKSTIVANVVDVLHRRLGYFHNAGYYELDGDDFDGVFRVGPYLDSQALPPYTEIIRLEAMRRLDDRASSELAFGLLQRHLHRAPADNPINRLGSRIERDLDWLRVTSPDDYHLWAFGTLRQCGASAELAASFCAWLGDARDDRELGLASERWGSLAQSAKSLQFAMARAARGRSIELDGPLRAMADDWQGAHELMRSKALSGVR